MARGKVYDLAIKIAGRVDSSLKKACLDADEQLGELAKTAEKIGKAAKVAAGVTTAAIGAVGVASVKAYTEHQQAANSMAAATGAAGEQLEYLQDAMDTVYTDNYGESLQDVADAVSLVDRNMKNISPDEIVEATEAALALQDTFEYGVEESTRAAAAIQKNFGGSAKEAFSLIAAGAQNGLDYSGELIDTINEYSSQFSKLGFTADGMFQLLQSGADSTAWNLDKVGDAIKEFSIRSIDGSDTTVAAFQALGYNASAMMETFAGGGDAANKAFYDVLNTLMDVDDQVQRDAIGVSLFGTMWEDLGAEAMQAMADASTAAYDTQGALDQINSVRYDDLGNQLEGVKRQAEEILWSIGEQLTPYLRDGLTFLSETVLPKVSTAVEKLGGYVESNVIPAAKTAAKWIGENKDMLLTLAGAIATAVGAYMALKTAGQAAGAIKGIGTVLGTAVKQGGLLKTVVGLLGGQFTVVIAIIAAVAGAFVILWNRSEQFRNAVMGILGRVQPLLQALGNFASMIWSNLAPAIQFIAELILNGLQNAFTTIAPIVENIMGVLTGLIEFLTGVFSGNWEMAWQGICDIASNLLQGLVQIVKLPINAIIGAVNSVIGAINSCGFTIPDWVPVLGGKSFSINLPTIPMLAAGGVATAPTLAMIGEGGEPEAVMPLSKLAELLDEWTKPKPQGGGGGQEDAGGDHIVWSPVFNFYGNATKEEAVAAARMSFAEFKKMYKQMKAEERRKSFSPA